MYLLPVYTFDHACGAFVRVCVMAFSIEKISTAKFDSLCGRLRFGARLSNTTMRGRMRTCMAGWDEGSIQLVPKLK